MTLFSRRPSSSRSGDSRPLDAAPSGARRRRWARGGASLLVLTLACAAWAATSTASARPAGSPASVTEVARVRGSQASASPAAFVTRSGPTLQLDGRPFRFSGANLYWTGLDENVGGIDPDGPRAVGYPSFFRIRDGLRSARALGATVVRAHTVGISTGTPDSLQPSYGTTNAAAWASMDYTVAQAGRVGVRLIVPLTDNWQYYHGGRYDFLRWLGLSTDDHGSAFYTDARARDAYQSYVRTVLTHVNRYTGLRYADDPTIMAWELGNEMDYATPDWVQANAVFVKGLAPSQLVAAGRSWRVDWAVMASPAVDISDSHYYPLDITAVHEDAAAVTGAGKVFVVGEYPSTDATDGNLAALASDPNVSGAAVWSLFPHADHYGFVQHDDGYTLHVPGDTPTMRASVASIGRFGAAMSGGVGAAVVSGPDTGAVEAPVVTTVTAPSGAAGRLVRWRGSAGAAAYRVQWTTSAAAPATSGPVLGGEVTSWTAPAATRDTSYAVLALDNAGLTLATSAPVRVGATGGATTDLLEDSYVASGWSPGLVRTPKPGGVALAPAPGATGWMAWDGPGVTAARFVVTGPITVPPVVETQVGSGPWTPAPTTFSRRASGAWAVAATRLQVDRVRLVWPEGSAFAVNRVLLTTG